jgi:hypothetical protein
MRSRQAFTCVEIKACSAFLKIFPHFPRTAVLQIPTRALNEGCEHTSASRSFINVGLPIGDQDLRPLVSVLQSSFIFPSIARCHVLYRLFIMAVHSFSRRRLPDQRCASALAKSDS